LPFILDLLEQEQIPRACFYHLVYSGRGAVEDDITHDQTRRALDLIIDRVIDFHKRGINKEILTVDNHADGVYLYLKIKERDAELAERIYEKLYRNGGNRSGVAICNVDHQGLVHPDQFSQYITLGNVREQSFADIWENAKHPVLTGLRNRRPLLKGRCSQCAFIDLCNGNFRPRALGFYGDYWASDPQCYLTDEEIGLGQGETDGTRLQP
jgi:radical SAM protein with 4Fe4S-binding SPASM domain